MRNFCLEGLVMGETGTVREGEAREEVSDMGGKSVELHLSAAGRGH